MIDGEVSVTFTKKKTWRIGRHSCSACGLETPKPTKAVAAQCNQDDHYIWPFDDWWPKGWLRVQGADEDTRYLCPLCAKKVP